MVTCHIFGPKIKIMKGFVELESKCKRTFENLGDVYHLWTQERFDLIFSCESDFKAGMGIFGICALIFPEVKVLTFELMSNHIHVAAAGPLEKILDLFDTFKITLSRSRVCSGRAINWDGFKAGTRKLETLEDVRNVIIYINRNGYLVSHGYTPFSYPWGANRYYFNPDAILLAQKCSAKLSMRDKRVMTNSHLGDKLDGPLAMDGYPLQTSFCDVNTGEGLFRDASHYFEKLSRSIESNKRIAEEIGEGIFYTDNELYAVISKICRERYGVSSPKLAPSDGKLELASTMRYEYNASGKQISRMLGLDESLVRSIFKS